MNPIQPGDLAMDRLRSVALVQEFVPEYSMMLKSQSRLQRLLGKIMFFNPYYMKSYWTTIGTTTYRPTSCDAGESPGEWEVVLHEGRHAFDAKKLSTILFSLLYLLPQLLGLLWIPVFLGLVFLGGVKSPLWLLPFITLAPIPSPFRAWTERRGYTTSVLCSMHGPSGIPDKDKFLDQFIVPAFTTGSYFWMWPFKKRVKAYFEKVLSGEYKGDQYDRRCVQLAKAMRDGI